MLPFAMSLPTGQHLSTGAAAMFGLVAASTLVHGRRRQQRQLTASSPYWLCLRPQTIHCAGIDDPNAARISPGVLAGLGAGALGMIVLLRRWHQSALTPEDAKSAKETKLRFALTKLRDRLAQAGPEASVTASALLEDPAAHAALRIIGLAPKDGGRPEVAALAALAAVMIPGSRNAFPPHFNEAVVVFFASIDGDGDAKLTDEEWCGFYSIAQTLGLFNFSPPPSCNNGPEWHKANAHRLYADHAGPGGLDLSEFGAWCRRHIDRGEIFRWYRRRT
jgi:hypothetical protein